MSTHTFKGYLLTILCGLVLLAAVIFIILQWGVTATYSLYGKPMTAQTVWLVLAAVIAGPILLWICRLFFRGVGILYRSRRAEARERRQLEQIADRASAAKPPAEASKPPDKPSSDLSA